MKHVKNFILSLIAIFIIAIPSNIIAGNIHVDAEHGNDATGDGSEENPYATIQKGVDEAVDDDKVLVDPKNDDGSPITYGAVTVDGKKLTIKRWGDQGYVRIQGNNGTDGNPPEDGEDGITVTGGAEVTLILVWVWGGNGGRSTDPEIPGADGGVGISADGAGTTVTKSPGLVTGGYGGWGAYGGGAGGTGGKGEQANGAHIKNLFDFPAGGGLGGNGGENPEGPGGEGGDGGIGAVAINNGLIEYVPSSMPSGGEGGIGGSGQPDGSPGSPGSDTYADPTSEIVMIEDIPTLTEWGMLLMGLLLLAFGTVAVVRKRRGALSRVS